MGVINTSSFAKALWPGLNAVVHQSYNEWPEEWRKLFTVESSSKAFEEDLGTSGFGLFRDKSEGSGVAYSGASQSYVWRYINKTYALGYIITQEMIEDNQYQIDVIGRKEAKAIGFSARQTKEVLGANILNNGFTGGPTYGDGKALLVSDHPKKAGGTFRNILSVAADLSEASLEQACIDIASFTNDAGLAIAVMPTDLFVPKELMFEATRILKSLNQNDTANNAINAVKSLGLFTGGPQVNHYLTDADAWFIKTNCPDGLKAFERVKNEFNIQNDFDTTNAKFMMRFRMSFGVSDPRGIFGSPGA